MMALSLIRPFVRAVIDPTRTDEIFKVISHPMITNADSFKTVYSFLTADEKTKATIDDRFMGQWNVPELAKLPKNTLGYHYSQFMITNDLKVDFYPKVEGPTPHAYLQTRSRQTHDIHHVLTGFDTSNIGEAGIHGFQYAQTKSPAAVAVFMIFLLHTCLFDRANLEKVVDAIADGWRLGKRAKLLFGQRYEDNWNVDIGDFRRELGLT